MWQQVESYRMGLYAAAAFRRLIKERSERETKYLLALEGWSFAVGDGNIREYQGWEELTDERRRELWKQHLQNQPDERFDRRRWLERRGEQIFEQLRQHRDPETGRSPARDALIELSGYNGSWEPAHNRMLMARHETSRSRGARLLDNVFQRVKEKLTNNDGDLRRRRQ